MTTERFENYIIVSGITSVDELMKADFISDTSIAAVVLKVSSEFSVSDAEKEFLGNCRFLTILYNSDFSDFSADFIMLFDLRLSESDYCITSDIFKELNTERYRLLCGSTDTYRLISCFSGKNSGSYKSRLVKHIDNADALKEYCDKLFKDKSSEEISCILKCLTEARSGSLEKVFGQESVNFYNMVRLKVKER